MLSLHQWSIPLDFHTHKSILEKKSAANTMEVKIIILALEVSQYQDNDLLLVLWHSAGAAVLWGELDLAYHELGRIPGSFCSDFGWLARLTWTNSFAAMYSKAKWFCKCLSGWMKTDASFLCLQSRLGRNSGLEVLLSCFLLLGNTTAKVINTSGNKYHSILAWA